MQFQKIAALAVFSLFGCDEASGGTFVVQIDGSKGLPFSGTCDVIDSGSSSTRDAAGKVPQSFSVIGSLISCEIQKQREIGELSITIRRDDGTVAARSSTSQPYGVAGAAGQ